MPPQIQVVPSPAPVPVNPVPQNAGPQPQVENQFQRPLAPVKNSHALVIGIVVIVLLALIGGVGAYAYTQDVWPFGGSPLDQTKPASSIFAGIGNIRTAAYALDLKVRSEPKETGAQSFSEAISVDPVKEAVLKRDQDTLRDIYRLSEYLRMQKRKSEVYPASLAKIVTDGGGSIKTDRYAYAPQKSGSDYTLKVTFEAPETVAQILDYAKKGHATTTTSATGNTVTYTANSYSYYIDLSRNLNEPAFIKLLESNELISYVPANFNLALTLEGASVKKTNNSIDGRLALKGMLDMGDINMALDAEFRKIADTFYVVVNKFPSFFYDISKLKNKWIKIIPDDLATYGSRYIGSDPEDTQKTMTEGRQKIAEGIKLFLTIADSHKALIISESPLREKIGTINAYKYDITFNKLVMADFYTDLAKEFENKFGDKSPFIFDQSTENYLKSPEFAEVFDYIASNTSLSLWVKKDGTPVQVEYSLRVVPPPEAKNASQQVRLVFTLRLNNINEEIKIETPSETISVEDVAILMSGQTKEQYRFSRQITNITNLQYSLSTYKQLAGKYPEFLDDLKKTRTDIRALNPKKANTVGTENLYTADYYRPSGIIYMSKYDKEPLLKSISSDVYEGGEYGYARSGDDYKITYTMKLPAYKAGDAVGTVMSRDYSSRSGTVTLKAIDGTNTANSKSVSLEAIASSNSDSDKDKLSDLFERYIGSNTSKTDTDGDGYSDYDEVIRGTNPLGPGNLKGGSYNAFPSPSYPVTEI